MGCSGRCAIRFTGIVVDYPRYSNEKMAFPPEKQKSGCLCRALFAANSAAIDTAEFKARGIVFECPVVCDRTVQQICAKGIYRSELLMLAVCRR
jgi:hypothetical protein